MRKVTVEVERFPLDNCCSPLARASLCTLVNELYLPSETPSKRIFSAFVTQGDLVNEQI